jgi:hypothetical protein
LAAEIKRRMQTFGSLGLESKLRRWQAFDAMARKRVGGKEIRRIAPFLGDKAEKSLEIV